MPATPQPGKSRPAVLVIAATDSSGGAGLIRDVRVLTDFSVDALCVTTAVTAQSDKRVLAVHHIPPETIRAQLTAALETRRVGAVKIGMLGTRTTVETVVESLAITTRSRAQPRPGGRAGAAQADAVGTPQTTTGPGDPNGSDGQPGPGVSIVLDPVLVSSSGGVLLDAEGRTALLQKLLPQVTLVTPNVPEVAALLGERVASSEAELIEQGRRLLQFGPQAILLKGGHARGEEATDLLIFDARRAEKHLYHPEKTADTPNASQPGHPIHSSKAPHENVADLVIERITSKRVPATSRGTGCALASAIAASLASGDSLLEACKRAKRYVLETLLTP
jgi:hydroxymethylpyrimidine/phosphomethylpyrimidine kinase